MGFRNATSCSCCAKEPCDCECPDTSPETVIGDAIVTIDGFTAGSEYECGLCQNLNGEFGLVPGGGQTIIFGSAGECLFDPTMASSMTCLGSYGTLLAGGFGGAGQGFFFCGEYEPLLYAEMKLAGRTYCAYEKDGKIYRDDTKPEGAKLIGRAIEIRLLITGIPVGIYVPGDYNCYSIELPGSLYKTTFDLCYAATSPYGFGELCCSTPIDVYSTLGTCLYDCGFSLDLACIDPACFIAYGFWSWRTILSTKRKCHGLNESLKLITDEEELSREYLFLNRRLRTPIGQDNCQSFTLCNPPSSIKLEI